MGKWNYRRTWRPKNYYRDQRIPSPPTYYDTEFKLRGAWNNADLPWEERFCISVGIPWQKVVNAKKYMHCYDNVVKWNDSAGESTFFEAKKQFWAKINDIPSDVPQPNPDLYNEEIDWNPNIDHELVKALDLAYFNPEEAEKLETYNATNRNDSFVPGCILGLNDNKPWERHKHDDLNDKTSGWDLSNKSESKNISDPWERGIMQEDRDIKDAWGGGGSSSWNKDVTWGNGAKKSGNDEITWGNNSWHQNQYRAQRINDNSKNTWDPVHRTTEFVQEKGWQSNGNNNRGRGNFRDRSFGRGQWHNGNNWESNVSCRKREGSHSQQYTSYKSARVQSDFYNTEGNQYRR